MTWSWGYSSIPFLVLYQQWIWILSGMQNPYLYGIILIASLKFPLAVLTVACGDFKI